MTTPLDHRTAAALGARVIAFCHLRRAGQEVAGLAWVQLYATAEGPMSAVGIGRSIDEAYRLTVDPAGFEEQDHRTGETA